MLGRQEAPLQIRYVEAVFDVNCVLSAFIVLDIELENALARDC
jgi:hypothetical protein